MSYLTADGKYFIDGNVYDMATRENLTEERRTRGARSRSINAVPESQMVIFSPKNPHYTITVFTDVDCQYCRKLHSEMAELNKLGVRVRYMFYPRTGPNTESWRKAEVVWCSADRNEALTRAKAGAPVDTNKTCGPTPVAREYALGQSIGVQGTPAIVTEGGDYINGYMPPHDLVQAIKQLQAGKARASGGTPLGAAAQRSRSLSLVLDAFPLLGVRRRLLLLADDRPFLGQIRIELLEVLLAGGNLFLGKDRFDRTLGLAQRAVDALVGIDHEKVRTLVKAVHRADFHAVHVLALDAAFGDDERHDLPF